MSTTIALGKTDRRKILPSLTAVQVGKTIDYIDKLVGAEGSRFDLGTGSITLPATREVDGVLLNPLVHNARCQGREVDCSIFFRGMNYFSGIARMASGARTVKPDSYTLDLIGNGGDFWRLVGALSMHDLPLGEVRVSRGNIQNSWNNSYATGWNHIFAPVLYGKPTGFTDGPGTDPAFSDLDFRPHVYHPAIIRAVEQATGYTITSDFFALPLFQDSVYVCTRAATQIKQVVDTFCQVSFLRTTSKTFLTGELLDWTNTSGCPYVSLSPGGSTFIALADMDIDISLNVSGSNLEEVFVTVNGPIQETFVAPNSSYINEVKRISVNSGDAIQLIVNAPSFGGSTFNFANLLVNRVYNPAVIADTDIYLATALHPHPVRDFLNAISHQFSLLWDINTVTKQIRVEPRFNYQVDGEQYTGFYDALTIKPVEVDQATIEHDHADFFGQFLKIGYQQAGGYLFTVLAGSNPLDVPVFGVRFDTGSSTAKGTEAYNNLFAVLPMFKYGSFSYLPAVLGDGYKQDSEDLPEEWTSEGPITTALVYRDNATILYDENRPEVAVKVAPLLAQRLPNTTLNGQPLDKNYQVAFSDGPVPGLVTMLYRQYLAVVQCPELVQATAPMKAHQFQQEDFRGLRAVQLGSTRSSWVSVSITDFDPAAGVASRELIKFMPVTEAVVNSIVHYG